LPIKPELLCHCGGIDRYCVVRVLCVSLALEEAGHCRRGGPLPWLFALAGEALALQVAWEPTRDINFGRSILLLRLARRR
jgi:hypothetical protein